MKYRKKPVVIDAIRYIGKLEDLDGFMVMTPEFLGLNAGHTLGGPAFIPTLEGNMMANSGDYIIKGVKGEFYPCKPDIFDMTYERMGENEHAEVSAAAASTHSDL